MWITVANAVWFAPVNAVCTRTFVAVGSWPLEFDNQVGCIAEA